MKQIAYRGYLGSVEVSIDDEVVFGKLLFIRDLVSYESDDIGGIKAAFHEAVDDYLSDCNEQGKEPDKPFKGSFNVRVDPTLHRDLALSASAEQVSLNEYIQKVLGCHRHIDSDGQIDRSLSEVRVVVESAISKSATSHSEPHYIRPQPSIGTIARFSGGSYPELSVVRSNKSVRVQ